MTFFPGFWWIFLLISGNLGEWLHAYDHVIHKNGCTIGSGHVSASIYDCHNLQLKFSRSCKFRTTCRPLWEVIAGSMQD